MQKKKGTKKVQSDKKASAVSASKAAGPSDKIFDVVRPGKAMPAESARPIIVTGRKLARDPMMVPETRDEASESVEATLEKAPERKLSQTKTRIEPLAAPAHTEPQPEETPATQPKPQPSLQVPEAKEEPSETTDSEVYSEDEPDFSKAPTKADTDAQTEAEAKRAAELEAMVQSKKYFVPINAVKRRQSMQVVIILLVIVILSVVGVSALAPDLLENSISTLTDLLPL
jgi:FtsZ-interacting cell division protein ZipA